MERGPCRIPSVRPPTSDCRPQGGHPCIERMRDAQGRSNALRPLQRRFKARKKPEGYTSTPTGLKRLRTQITAFHGNRNGKGTPSGVPKSIHKRKLILVKEEFDASSFGGDGGSRTHVQKYFRRTFSERSQCFVIRSIRRDADTLRNCYPVSPLKYQELFQRFPAFMTPDFKPAGEPEAARGAELCSQCEIVVIFSVYI